ncbi:MAG: DUF4276 family protein [Candidatus Hydrogenedentes bacterium]|nr:DUF4276 family protein [Candidatus Hydrogenedentota bacterium]
MIRVHVVCEGQTEEMFVNEVLAEYMLPHGVSLRPSLIGKPGRKGGNVNQGRLIGDIGNRLRSDTGAYCTSIFDYYGLPQNFPGKPAADRQGTSAEKARVLLQALQDELEAAIGTDLARRFIPYVQMYEFESLLFSDTDGLARGINQVHLSDQFRAIRDAFPTPEDINDDPLTAPGKRIKACYPGYDKVYLGSLAALEIGIESIRSACPLFSRWIAVLESLGESRTGL